MAQETRGEDLVLFWSDLKYEMDRLWDRLSTKYTKKQIMEFLKDYPDLKDAFEEWFGEGDDEEDTSEEDTGREGSRETR